jgi:hypothetical protein
MNNKKLIPRFDTRKSFYGKAKVKQMNGKKVLQSYQTDVAEIEKGKPFVKGLYSTTTTRHIKEFLKQQGFKAETSKQIMKDYGIKNRVRKKIKKNKDNHLKTIGMVAQMGDIFGKTQKEKSAWKVRMLKAGLQNRGLSIPKDWDMLPEKEKKKRLDKTMKVLMES